jgi:hypothetical protein
MPDIGDDDIDLHDPVEPDPTLGLARVSRRDRPIHMPEPEEALLRPGEAEGVAAGPVSAADIFDREEDKDGRPYKEDKDGRPYKDVRARDSPTSLSSSAPPSPFAPSPSSAKSPRG